MKQYNWATLGCGVIAHQLAEAMEAAIFMNERDIMHLDYTKDVMDMMTSIREEWGMKYPEEEIE